MGLCSLDHPPEGAWESFGSRGVSVRGLCLGSVLLYTCETSRILSVPCGGAFPFLMGLLNFNVFPPLGSARHCGERLTRDTSFSPELLPGAVAGFFICPDATVSDATVSDATLRLRHLFLGRYPEVLCNSLQGHR